MVVFFFFSSRRRHTRCSRDWSSDVCSSDLVTREYRGADFFVRDAGRLFATPLFVVLLVVEITDVTLAIDSIPAVFGITRDPFIVYTSNVLAILGLRALYFLLAGIIDRLRFLDEGLAGGVGCISGREEDAEA